MEETDEELMRLVASGDRAAFRTLMERYGHRLLGLASNSLRNTAVAEEVVQEAFVRVWLGAHRFDARRAQLTTWLHRIVVNLCIDQVRKRRPGSDESLEFVADEALDGLGTLLDVERRDALHRAVRLLPIRQRVALTLFHFNELSARECAEAMELSDSAFESLLLRARSALRQALYGYMNH